MDGGGDLFASVLPTVEVELFECERYQPLAGWSAEHLLPTDRRRYRARDSTSSWASLPEAEEALLPAGWAWDPLPWQVEPQEGSGAEGWAYATTFPPNWEGSPEAGQFSIVRWRRLERLQSFAGAAALLRAVGAGSEAVCCLQVDLEAAGRIGRQLQDAVAAASLHGEWSVPALVRLKRELVGRLLEGPREPGEALEAALIEFAKDRGGVMARARRSLLGPENPLATSAGRSAQLEAIFPAAEREALAGLAMRRWCPQLACGLPDLGAAGHDCPFRQVICPHAGCCERISARAGEAHDTTCRFKPVACGLCGEPVLRGQLAAHTSAACPEREATCNFASLGCSVQLTHRTLVPHLESCTQAHMLLLMEALREQQDTVKLLVRAHAAEQERRAQEQEEGREAVKDLARQVAALGRRMDQLEQQRERDLGSAQTELTGVRNKLTRLEAAVSAEAFRRVTTRS